MNLNLFDNFKKDICSNVNIKNFMNELSDFLNSICSSVTQNININNTKEIENDSSKNTLNEHRKEDHLYFVTEDRMGEIYLWDFTDKPNYEFKEVITSKELLSVATEGAMLQYKNGKYELYSKDGYEMLFNEQNK